MKLNKRVRIGYKCDKCGKYRNYIDMHDDSICYDCWMDKQKHKEVMK